MEASSPGHQLFQDQHLGKATSLCSASIYPGLPIPSFPDLQGSTLATTSEVFTHGGVNSLRDPEPEGETECTCPSEAELNTEWWPVTHLAAGVSQQALVHRLGRISLVQVWEVSLLLSLGLF